MSERIVIGIDPGPRESAVVQWDGSRVLHYCDAENDELLDLLPRLAGEVSIEWIESFGMAVGQTVFQTVFAIGTIAAGCPGVRLIPRRDVKLNLCGQSRAKDANIRQALIDRFGIVGTKKTPGPLFGISGHRWSALAIAVTAFDLERTDHEADFHREAKGAA